MSTEGGIKPVVEIVGDEPNGYTSEYLQTMKGINDSLATEFDRLKTFVVNKNVEYGNSLQNPIGVFSKSPMEGILGRIDDKMGRIKTMGVTESTLDTIDDLVGYLVHLRIMYNKNLKK